MELCVVMQCGEGCFVSLRAMLRLSVVGEVESTVEAGLVRAARLRQAVLRSAFEGRL
jgi:hypothetical protein